MQIIGWIPVLIVLALAGLALHDLARGRREQPHSARSWYLVRAGAACLLILPVLLPTVLGNVDWPALLLPLVLAYLLGGLALIVSTTVLYTLQEDEPAGD